MKGVKDIYKDSWMQARTQTLEKGVRIEEILH